MRSALGGLLLLLPCLGLLLVSLLGIVCEGLLLFFCWSKIGQKLSLVFLFLTGFPLFHGDLPGCSSLARNDYVKLLLRFFRQYEVREQWLANLVLSNELEPLRCKLVQGDCLQGRGIDISPEVCLLL